MAIKNSLTVKEQTLILEKLQTRFESNMHRHPEFHWLEVQKKLESNPDKLWPLILMEATEGEPDVVGTDSITSQYVFFDCSKESPRGRRSICFDRQAQLERKKYPPRNNAEEMAAELGIEMLDESQ
ncbi:Protein of unknown function [Marivirga sericea]|uniref:DUF4256 domain-containing protein n=1 Tax=Marivirga sericea TaxID=1028 RepID=A0A1X7ILP7_9BACT|nr:Protein of unknown function [Marivirga sericea]